MAKLSDERLPEDGHAPNGGDAGAVVSRQDRVFAPCWALASDQHAPSIQRSVSDHFAIIRLQFDVELSLWLWKWHPHF